MTSLSGKSAVVIGGSSGVGEATVRALISEGVRVTAVARGTDKLRAIKLNAGGELSTLQGDGTDPAFVERLLRERKPDLVVLTAGVTPRMGPVDEFDWQSFSEPWNADVKSTFLLL